MERRIITENELKKMIDGGEEFLLLDVLPPEYFNQKHIQGAKNAPVYEMIFLEYVEKFTDDKSRKIVVYCEDVDSLATWDAATKLAKAGYVNVWEFPGGLTKWEKAGYPLEKGEEIREPEIEDGEYAIDEQKSLANWIGRNFKYAHRGTIAVRNGNITFSDKRLSGGKIVLDMNAIEDMDLADSTMKKILETHLKSSDFFDVKNFPEAFFEIKKAEKMEEARAGTSNYEIDGTLTIKDVSREISFSAMILPMPDGTINGQAHFDFDRTIWNVRYGSEKFFEKLGMHLVNDVVSLELFLVAVKK